MMSKARIGGYLVRQNQHTKALLIFPIEDDDDTAFIRSSARNLPEDQAVSAAFTSKAMIKRATDTDSFRPNRRI
ncbi:hypothetical protein [Vibrio cortegadensis]|uniref:hypothetical protein n=1 Tax=Vibrio cortegadensis TaxID=1328770 RepID=UPI0021C26D33|nr:hypothetical protein [Vibrio cortegadensis]